MISFILAFFAIVAATTSAQSIVYQDYTSGVSFILPTVSPQNQVTDFSYDTTHPGQFSFGVDWNGDADDLYSITLPSVLSLTVLNDVLFCTPNIGTSQVILSVATVLACNYTVAYPIAFSGVMSVNYLTGANVVNPREETINVFFSNETIRGGIVGDPVLTGFRSQVYQVHGIDGYVYSLISTPTTAVNSRFVFLEEGKCFENMTTHCWSHEGSYIGEIGIVYRLQGSEPLQTLLLKAGSAITGFKSLTVNGNNVNLFNNTVISIFPTFRVSVVDEFTVNVKTDHFELTFYNSDFFMNQEVKALIPLRNIRAHGLLGQTVSREMTGEIQGEVDEYAIDDGSMFGTEFVYSLFNGGMLPPLTPS